MASPQLEEGYLKVAFSLSAAIAQAGFSGLEHDIIWTVMNLTYGRNQTKAEISIDDIRYLLGNRSNARSQRVEGALESLIEKQVIFRQTVNQNVMVLGLQKDFEKWGANVLKTANLAPHVVDSNNNIITTTPPAKMAKPTVPEQFMGYVAKLSQVTYKSQKLRQMELGRAINLYTLAMQELHSSSDAAFALRDYADYVYEDEWVRNNVTMPLAYMGKNFDKYLRVLPKKPKYIQEQEAISGKRMRYNLRTKQWGQVK